MPRSPESYVEEGAIMAELDRRLVEANTEFIVDLSADLELATVKVADMEKKLNCTEDERLEVLGEFERLEDHEVRRKEWLKLSTNEEKKSYLRQQTENDLDSEAYDLLFERFKKEQFRKIPVVVRWSERIAKEFEGKMQSREEFGYFGSLLEGELEVDMADQLIPKDKQSLTSAIRVRNSNYYYLSEPGTVEPGVLEHLARLSKLGYTWDRGRFEQYDAEFRAEATVRGKRKARW